MVKFVVVFSHVLRKGVFCLLCLFLSNAKEVCLVKVVLLTVLCNETFFMKQCKYLLCFMYRKLLLVTCSQ